MSEHDEVQVPRHPIRVVAQRTGLSLDVLRVWEKRYAVVAPRRHETGRRLYSDADVERLRLLRQATQGGRSISQVAPLPTAELLALVQEDERARVPRAAVLPAAPAGAVGFLEAALAAVRALDGRALEVALQRAALVLRLDELLDGVMAPLLRRLGEAWQSGELGVAHEHLASAVLRRVLGGMGDGALAPRGAPELVVATPAGQRHEFGALLVAAAAVAEGWRVTYLGADLPAEEMAGAARQRGARAVALSLVYPADDPQLAGELRRLARALPEGVRLLLGGRAAARYRPGLEAPPAVWLADLTGLRALLRESAGGEG